MAALTGTELAACLPSDACANGAWELISGPTSGGFCGTGSPVACEAGIVRALGKFDHTVGQVCAREGDVHRSPDDIVHVAKRGKLVAPFGSS
eukprot:scaffold132447_cov33-Tisochrysis_lutea.AAC.2